MYLTFDEGYEFGLSGQILDTLKEKGVKAIFFITGDFAKAEPELVQRMIDEGMWWATTAGSTPITPGFRWRKRSRPDEAARLCQGEF